MKETLVEVRSNFWIPKGRQYVKMILHQCVICKKREGLPYRPPLTTDLPDSRVSGSPVFNHVGVDFASLVYMKSINTHDESVHLPIYLCNLKSVTPRTNTRSVNGSLYQMPVEVHNQTREASLHNE